MSTETFRSTSCSNDVVLTSQSFSISNHLLENLQHQKICNLKVKPLQLHFDAIDFKGQLVVRKFRYLSV